MWALLDALKVRLDVRVAESHAATAAIVAYLVGSHQTPERGLTAVQRMRRSLVVQQFRQI